MSALTTDQDDPVSQALLLLLRRHQDHLEGKVADYIPELAGANPDDFGVAGVSMHGHCFGAGDSKTLFTIQSISKPFVYALAIASLGLEEVGRHVGFEPSGEPFNAISLDAVTGRPANPLINAGAIVTSSLVDGASSEERFERIRLFLSSFAGRELIVDEQVYESESSTGDRNRALAHLARSAGVLSREVNDAVEVYFRQCSLLVTAEDLALMAATLGNGGVNPVTDEEVISEDVATYTMSVMATCGMYDQSGEWMVRVGLPAKSGVGGGIVAIKPGQFGLGVYSPPLDAQGNSTRGVAVLEDLSAAFRLHLFAHPRGAQSPIIASEFVEGDHVISLRGEMDFVATEQVVYTLRELAEDFAPSVGTVRLDLTGVTRFRGAAEQLLSATAVQLANSGLRLVAYDPNGLVTGVDSPFGPPLQTVTLSSD